MNKSPVKIGAGYKIGNAIWFVTDVCADAGGRLAVHAVNEAGEARVFGAETFAGQIAAQPPSNEAQRAETHRVPDDF